MTGSAQRAALNELRSLRATGMSDQDLCELIEVPEALREKLQEFCRKYPKSGRSIQASLVFRDFMMEVLL